MGPLLYMMRSLQIGTCTVLFVPASWRRNLILVHSFSGMLKNCGARLVRRKSFMFEICIRTDPHVTRSVFEELEHLCAMQEIPGGELWKVSFSQWLSFRQFLKAKAHSRCHERSILVVTLVRLGFPGTALKPPRIFMYLSFCAKSEDSRKALETVQRSSSPLKACSA